MAASVHVFLRGSNHSVSMINQLAGAWCSVASHLFVAWQVFLEDPGHEIKGHASSSNHCLNEALHGDDYQGAGVLRTELAERTTLSPPSSPVINHSFLFQATKHSQLWCILWEQSLVIGLHSRLLVLYLFLVLCPCLVLFLPACHP